MGPVAWTLPPPLRARPEQRRAHVPEETHSVAVLPFADLSPGKDQEYLSDGIAEQITSALAEVGGLRVAARTSAFSFKGKAVAIDEIGARLHVTHIIEGSVRRAGDRLRVTVQLIDVSNGFEVWSNSYDRKLHDILAVQEDISRSIIERLHVQLTGREQNALTHPEGTDKRRTICISGDATPGRHARRPVCSGPWNILSARSRKILTSRAHTWGWPMR